MLSAIKHNLKELGFGTKEIKVYIALTQLGEAKAVQIAKKADLPRTTVISILNKIKNENYITTNRYRGTTYYWIESPKTFLNILETKKEIAEQLNKQLTGLYRQEAHFPIAEIYDTKTTIKQFIQKLIANLEKKSTIYTIDAPGAGNYTKIYANEVRSTLLEQKFKKGILTHTLVPYGSFKGIDEYKIKKQPIEIRELPKELNFSASFWLLKDKIVHFSGNPPFMVIIKHEAIVASMKNIYDYLWNISAPKT